MKTAGGKGYAILSLLPFQVPCAVASLDALI
jgi:hypothetical protein